MEIAWHYTFAHKWASICRDGFLCPAYGGIEPTEKAAVWFSTHPTFEPTATKDAIIPHGPRIRLTLAQCMEATGGAIRIGVPLELTLSFLQYRKRSGVSRKEANRLVTVGRSIGADCGQWRVIFGNVESMFWTSVQRMDSLESGWQEIEKETYVDEAVGH